MNIYVELFPLDWKNVIVEDVSYGKWQIIAKKIIIKIIIVYFNLLFPIIAKKKNTIALEISCLILKKYISLLSVLPFLVHLYLSDWDFPFKS